MGKMQHVELSVSGKLDTANPSTNRTPGTLLEATDVAPLWWGPRNGFTQQTWPYQSGAFPNQRIPIFDGNNGRGVWILRVPDQRDLPNRWTLDTVIRPSGVTHSSDTNLIINQWDLDSTTAAITLGIKGGGAASGDQRKLYATITGTSSAGVAGTSATITGTTQLTVGTALANTHHVRLVRDGAGATLTCDGVTEGTTSALVATERHQGGSAATVVGHMYLCGTNTGGNHLYAGRILATVLRVGAGADATKGLRDFAFAKSPAVRFAMYGANGSSPGGVESSLFQTYGGFTATYDEVTDPAPWAIPRIQGGTSYVDKRGRRWNFVNAGGSLFWRRAT